MRLGIMQPYAFPYLGYFQLIAAADRFIAYDDVNFIKQGWINRNRVLVNGAPFMFTIPLQDAGSFRQIKDIRLDPKSFPLWRTKFCRTLTQVYARAACFETAYPLLAGILAMDDERTISQLAIDSLSEICTYLNITTPIQTSAGRYDNETLAGEERILDICRQEEADQYINAIGGQELYHTDAFAEKGVKLRFIKSHLDAYDQGQPAFTPGLSIIDVLMHNTADVIKRMLNSYELITT